VLLGELGVDDHGHGDAHVGEGELVLAQELDAEGEVVHDLELLRLLERPRFHLERGKPPTVTARS